VIANLNQPENVRITYKNWKGKTSDRTVKPLKIYFGLTEYHPENQWLLHAYDYEKQDFRTFAMKDISSWNPVEAE
jgi:predicted DNA-binding transcriptional regulator YafY